MPRTEEHVKFSLALKDESSRSVSEGHWELSDIHLKSLPTGSRFSLLLPPCATMKSLGALPSSDFQNERGEDVQRGRGLTNNSHLGTHAHQTAPAEVRPRSIWILEK